ncbi:hypothetical protein [uncultured Alistipes sp.]|uniref:hypothetical protein n=1 Tax=uncultured Alistipes sp. TaxID=538949 RepID=UPI0025E22A55|nr:hypothetical protein [uncultured Alistipes sp.]
MQLLLGLALGLVLAFLLYILMYYFREILRLLWIDSIYYDVVILSRKEMNFYNVICAYISVIFGQSLVFTFWFNRSRRRCGRLSSKLDRFISGLWPLNILAFWMLVQLVAIVGMCFFWRTDYEFGVYPDFIIYFILMIVVLFLQQWLTVGQVFKRKGIKWMLISAPVISAISLGMSRINFTDYEALNDRLRSKSIYHNYYIDWPTVAGFHSSDLGYNYWLDGNIYVVNSKNYPADTAPIIVMNNMNFYSDETLNDRTFREVLPDSVGSVVACWQAYKKADTVFYSYGNAIESYHLKINRNIPMAFVNKLKTDLSKARVRKVRYAVLPSIYRPGETFRAYDDWVMISTMIPEYYSYPADRRKAEYEKRLTHSNIIDLVQADAGQYLINGEPVETKDLIDKFKTVIVGEPDYMIRYYIDDNAVFQDYIDVFWSALQAVRQLRAEYIVDRYGEESLWNGDINKEAQRIYPLRMLEIANL